MGTSFKNFHSRKSDSLFTLSRTVKSLTGNEGPSVNFPPYGCQALQDLIEKHRQLKDERRAKILGAIMAKGGISSSDGDVVA